MYRFNERFAVPIVMIAYYLITVFVLAMLVWNFIRESSNKEHMLLYLLIMIPLALRLFRVK